MRDDTHPNGDSEDFEIGDVESFSSRKDEGFSHPTLVMLTMRRVAELGAKEMMNGWFNEKTDKHGNVIRTYIDDTRKSLIEGIKTCLMIISCDFDEPAKTKVDELKELLIDKKKELIIQCDIFWNTLQPCFKNELIRKGLIHYKGCLDIKNYEQIYTDYEVDVYRDIFAELSNLTVRLEGYKGEVFEA